MKPRTGITFALAIMTGISAAPLAADQTVAASAGDVRTQSVTEIHADPITTVSARLAKARTLMEQGRYREAKREYAAIAKQQKVGGTLADEALWRLGSLYYADGDLRRAALTFDRLAHEAESYGDPVLQARALLEAAVLYQRAGMSEKVMPRVERVELLLASPYMSAEVRDGITRRISRA